MRWNSVLQIDVPAWLLDYQAELQAIPYVDDAAKMRLVIDCAQRNVSDANAAPLAAAVFHKNGALISVGVDAPGLGGHEMSNALLIASNSIGTDAFRSSDQYEMFSLAPPCMVCLGNIFSERLARFVCAVTHAELLSWLSLPNTPMPAADWAEFLMGRGVAVEIGIGRKQALLLLDSYGVRGASQV